MTYMKKKGDSIKKIDSTRNRRYVLSIVMIKGKLYYLKGSEKEYELYKYDGNNIE